jgi:V/A-type H+-transporting ATPase subunit I
MAISRMAKILIASHHSEAADLLEALQHQGICQILNAEEGMVCKKVPDLYCGGEKPKDIENFLGRLQKSVAFLDSYAQKAKGLGAALSPRIVVDPQAYNQTVVDKDIPALVEQCEQISSEMENLYNEREGIYGHLDHLGPWAALQAPVEQLGEFEKAACLAGLLPAQKYDQVEEDLAKLDAAIQIVGTAGNRYACLAVCLKEQSTDVHKLLRSADFEAVTFEHMTGRVTELINNYQNRLSEIDEQLQQENGKAKELSENMLKLQILCDHNTNLLSREQAKSVSPATEQTIIYEGWVREKDYSRLEKTVSKFHASSLSRTTPAESEEIPVEIENKNIIKPFEVITRLYGMPKHFEVDPTVFLAPFFALFFALCLTDAGYGLILIGVIALFIKKMQGDKKLMLMLGICSVITLGAGALTGGWFGDAIQKFIPALNPLREKMMWFDPFEKPMLFFVLSLAIGYIHILTGLLIAFFHNLKQKDYTAAVCDQLTWLVMLNAIVLFGASKAGAVPAGLGSFCGKFALVPAGTIFLFSQREGAWAGRLGMGAYNLFSAIFYMGDVLSYLRLMALGMVTAGLGMAINVIAKITLDIPYIGFVIMIAVLVGGHTFNLAISGLSAFVHTLRLQYVEFFPKFLVGGGRLFEPLAKEYKHIFISKDEK